jgi:hypothetical protein
MRKFLLIALAALSISVSAPAAPFQSKPKHKKVQVKDYIVYVTRTGAKYHLDGCQYLRRSQYEMSKREAVNQGYTACSRCNP